MEKFNWERLSISKDDYKCMIGPFLLRVEQMNKGYWWWRVYKSGESITLPEQEHAPTKEKAFSMAEGFWRGYKQGFRDGMNTANEIELKSRNS